MASASSSRVYALTSLATESRQARAAATISSITGAELWRAAMPTASTADPNGDPQQPHPPMTDVDSTHPLPSSTVMLMSSSLEGLMSVELNGATSWSCHCPAFHLPGVIRSEVRFSSAMLGLSSVIEYPCRSVL